MSKEASLGTYIIRYFVPQRDVSYEQTLQVKEFTKPNYEIRTDILTGQDLVLHIDPRYYFGAPLGKYSLGVSASLVPEKTCWYCRWNSEQEEDGYNNFQFGTAPSDRMDISWVDQS